MKDKEFLEWIYARLVHQYGENPNIDYMRKLRCVIAATPEEQLTPNTK